MIEIQVGNRTISFRIEKNGNYWKLMNDEIGLVMVGYVERGEVYCQSSQSEIALFEDELFEMVQKEFKK